GLFPIGWIILNLIFLYQLTVDKGWFDVLRGSLGAIAPDPRVQVILIAFSFGAFFEGAAGFGTPVAVTAAILIQLGFKPLQACGLSLIANTAPVAFGALGTPIIALSKVTGFDEVTLSKMVGRQLPFFSVLVPFWVVWAQAGWRGMLGVWPAALVAGVSFAVPQFLVSNLHGPWLVDIVAALCSMGAVVLLLKVWQPKDGRWPMADGQLKPSPDAAVNPAASVQQSAIGDPQSPIPSVRRAWVPWILLSVLVFLWGTPQLKNLLDGKKTAKETAAALKLTIPDITGGAKLRPGVTAPEFPVWGLHNLILRTNPVVELPTPGKPTKPEEAIFKLNWFSATGTGILCAAVLAGFFMGFSLREL